MSSKATKGKKPVKESEANPKLLIVMTQHNLKFVMGKPLLTVGALKQVGKSCVKLHNYYIVITNRPRHNSVVQGRSLSSG
jgi:hypothetical protein